MEDEYDTYSEPRAASDRETYGVNPYSTWDAQSGAPTEKLGPGVGWLLTGLMVVGVFSLLGTLIGVLAWLLS